MKAKIINKMPKIVQKVITKADKNAPVILTAIAVVGVVSTVVAAVKATPTAKDVVDEAKDDISGAMQEADEKGWPESEVKQTVKEIRIDTTKKLAKIYAPTIITGVGTITCIIGAQKLSLRRQAALAAAYNLTESTLREYQKKAKELLGEKKEAEIRDHIAKKQLEKNPKEDTAVIVTGKGDYLCYDEFSGRYFRSTSNKVQSAVNDLNFQLLSDLRCTLNDFYDLLGLEGIGIGDEIGWDVDEGKLEIIYTYQGDMYDEPCLVLNYEKKPGPFNKSFLA